MDNSKVVEDEGWRRIWRIISDLWTDSERRVHYYRKARRQLLKHPWLRWLGHAVHRQQRAKLAADEAEKHQYTLFLRNRAMMRALSDLIEEREWGESIRLLSLGSSRGAELYSAVWVVRRACTDLHVDALGVDIDEDAIATAQAGRYEPTSVAIRGEEGSGASGLTPEERDSMLTRDGEYLKVRSWIKENVQWLRADVSDPALPERIEPADIVFCNAMLCHMPDEKAAACLSNILHLVRPSRYLFVTGVNLNVKTRVLRQADYRPVPLRVEEIYHDPAHNRTLRNWPFGHCSREPMERNRSDWLMRYGAIFQAPSD